MKAQKINLIYLLQFILMKWNYVKRGNQVMWNEIFPLSDLFEIEEHVGSYKL